MALNFDPAVYDTPVPYTEIPDGEHQFIVLDHKYKVWDDGGASLSFRLQCLSEGFEKKSEFAKFNIVGNDPEKEKKARSWLVQFQKACGVESVSDYEDPVELDEKVVIGTIQTWNGKKGFLSWGWKSVNGTSKLSTPPTSSTPSLSDAPKPHEDDAIPF